MKESELKCLIREIVKGILKEYTSYSDRKDMIDANPQLDPNTPPEDAMTLKQKETELDVEKKRMDLNKRMTDQQKRFSIPKLNKDLQRLKGASNI
jgi:hypothetical protein